MNKKERNARKKSYFDPDPDLKPCPLCNGKKLQKMPSGQVYCETRGCALFGTIIPIPAWQAMPRKSETTATEELARLQRDYLIARLGWSGVPGASAKEANEARCRLDLLAYTGVRL